jgi:hypothetical protein
LNALQNALETHEHNARIEKHIKENGDPDGLWHKHFKKPRYWINNLFILAQITDDEDDPMMEETYNIQEGGAVAFQDDGAKNEASFVRDLPPVMFL